MGYTHISENERRRIERALTAKKSLRKIATMIGRSVSSVSEEISSNSVRGVYKADAAQKKAVLRRKRSKVQCLKVAMDPALKEYVTKDRETSVCKSREAKGWPQTRQQKGCSRWPHHDRQATKKGRKSQGIWPFRGRFH